MNVQQGNFWLKLFGYLICSLLFTINNICAQISLDSLKFNVTAGSYYQYPYGNKIMIPDEIKSIRLNNNHFYNKNWTHETDNPIHHIATYFVFNTKSEIHKNVTLNANLICEDRGFSFGTYNQSSFQIIPQFNLKYKKELRYSIHNIRLDASFGNLQKQILYEGLTLNNLYQQGYNYSVFFDNFFINYTQISDLYYGIGLNIDDSRDLILGLNNVKLFSSKHLEANIKLGLSNYSPSPSLSNKYNLYNFVFKITKDKNLNIYAQYSYRNNELSNVTLNLYNNAFLLGINGNYTEKSTQIKYSIEGRYYGKLFNAGFNNTGVYYRNGSYIYPLFLIDQPFNQWSIYTEYGSKAIKSISSIIKITKPIKNELFYKLDVEANLIQSDLNKPFIYCFYDTGIGFQDKDNSIYFSLTNKGMNLDIHYPSFYMYVKPVMQVSFRRILPNNW